MCNRFWPQSDQLKTTLQHAAMCLPIQRQNTMKTQNNRPSVQDVKAAAHGNWQNILASLGMEQKLLNGKHQPCPSRGGKDRFRYTDFQGNGGLSVIIVPLKVVAALI